MPRRWKYQRRCWICKKRLTTNEPRKFKCDECIEKIRLIEEKKKMVKYKAVKCSKCLNAFASTRKERMKCTFCGCESKNHIVLLETEKAKEMSDTVAKYNYDKGMKENGNI